MIIRRIEHRRQMWVKTEKSKYNKAAHTEIHLVTTYYLLFIPIYRSCRLKSII